MKISRRAMLMAGVLAGGKLLLPPGLARATGAPTTRGAGIDRQALVGRHNPVITKFDPFSALTVGNGNFAFTADITGLQTFAPQCAKLFPICTCSHWAWHTTPLPAGIDPKQYKFREYPSHGRMVGYATEHTGQEELYAWLRENPHRMHLGQIGFDLKRADGSAAGPDDLANTNQTLDLWTGMIDSRFQFAGKDFHVQTACDSGADALAIRIDASSDFAVRIAFPYASPEMAMADWNSPEKHSTHFQLGQPLAVISRMLDADRYSVFATWSGASPQQAGPHELLLTGRAGNRFELMLWFTPSMDLGAEIPTVDQVFQGSAARWQDFWIHGAAIDLSASTDERADELERRIVLSQYNTAINCSGTIPPQESGLLFNTWFGKAHLEMHWWHGAHFAAWNRFELLDRSLDFYHRILPVAQATAQRQGYSGARWPKMVGPEGRDSPSPIAPLLIWQQPHPIYYAELSYRRNPGNETLGRWSDIVFETADFLASFAALEGDRYVLGPPLKPVPEDTDTMHTKNPTFELAYCRFALRTAQVWRERMGLPRNPKWADVLDRLSPLPVDDGLYLMMEGMTDTYTKWNYEHPSPLGAYGMQPGDGVDRETMRRSLAKVLDVWQWDRCWGWDFPMAAMTAAKLGEPELAAKALMIESIKNKYLPNGHVYQRPNLPAYLPANGGLLAATAMMALRGGFPAGWGVKSEGLVGMI